VDAFDLHVEQRIRIEAQAGAVADQPGKRDLVRPLGGRDDMRRWPI